MRCKKIKVSTFITIVIIILVGCNNSKNAIDFGMYKEGVYTNTYFNLKVTIPESWYVMDDETRIEHMKKTSKLLSGNDENLKAILNASDINNMMLIYSSEYPTGAPVTSNPSFIITAEKVKHMPGIVRGKDYHYHTKKMMESGAIKMTFPREIYTVQIDNISFDVLEVLTPIRNDIIKQKQYVAILNGYALSLGITYSNDADLQKLESIISAINFDL